MERLTPIIGVQISLSFYAPEISRYRACRIGLANMWLRNAVRKCPPAIDFLNLPPLEAKKAPLDYETSAEMGYEIPLLRVRKPCARSINNNEAPGTSASKNIGSGETVPSRGTGIFGFPIVNREVKLRATVNSAVNISRGQIFERHGFGQRTRDLVVR